MRKTYCVADMKFIDVLALADATVSSGDNQSFGNLVLFHKVINQKTYGTLELNQFLLDGNQDNIPDTPEDVAFWSTERSDSDCIFQNPPVIEVNFSENHSSAGFTLYFEKEYPTEIKITWYTLSGLKIIDKTFYPDSNTYVCRNAVQDYGKIRIEFIGSQFPDRYVALQYILYGLELSWKDDLIKTASVQEEIDLTSATLSVNTANISILDVNNDFDISNENGAWKSVQKTQEIALTEYVNGKLIPAGVFYIDKQSFKNNIASFSMIDAIGLMDKYTFFEGEIYTAIKAGILIEKVFSCAGITKYFISDEVYSTLLTGYLGVQSCRAALQMICFACRAVADDSRSDAIRITRPDRYADSTIDTNRKFSGHTQVQQDEYVSGVSIECRRYILDSEVTEIYKGTLPAGRNKIIFSTPCSPESINCTGATLEKAVTNYAIVYMKTAGECTLSGIQYTSKDFAYQKSVPLLEAGETENIKRYGVCTLYNTGILPDNAEYLLNYHSLRKKVNMKYIPDTEQAGNWVNIRDVKGNTATTVIESQTLDLTGGFLAMASCRGYSRVVTDYMYMSEFYMNEEIGVM